MLYARCMAAPEQSHAERLTSKPRWALAFSLDDAADLLIVRGPASHGFVVGFGRQSIVRVLGSMQESGVCDRMPACWAG